MTRKLSKPQVSINGVVIYIVPNSLKVVYGFGDKNVEAQSAGGNSVSLVTAHDVTKRISKIDFEIFPDDSNVDFLLNLMESNDDTDFDVSFSEPGLVAAGSIPNASITNDPEHAYSADGKIPVEIMGTKVKRS